MNQATPPQSSRAGRVAVCEYRSGRVFSLCVTKNSGGINVESAAESDAATFDFAAWAKRQRAEELVWVVSGTCSVIRAVPFEAIGDPEQAAAALSLRSEIEYPAEPAHRRGSGAPLPSTGPRTSAVFITVTDPPAGAPWLEGGGALTTPGAALCGLLRLGGRAAVACDEVDGTVSMVALGGSGLVARALRTGKGSREACLSRAQSAVAEAFSGAGVAFDGSSMSGGVTVDDPGAVRARVSGVTADENWLSRFGLALGAGSLVLSGDPLVSGLVGLSARPIAPGGSAAQRFMRWASVPRNAFATIGLGIAALLLLPLGVSMARTGVLEGKASNLDSMQSDMLALDQRSSLYQQLDASRWPMTKLLAVISRCAPEGVELESVQVAHGQAVAIQGTAAIDNTEAPNAFAATLRASGLFTSVNEKRADMTGEKGIEFEITAVVGNAHAEPSKTLPDYAETPLAVRLYGEGATNTRWSASTPASARSTRSASRPSRESTGDRERASERPTTSANFSEEPKVLSDADIAAMDKMTALKERTVRRAYMMANDSKMPSDLKSRLESEVARLDERRSQP